MELVTMKKRMIFDIAWYILIAVVILPFLFPLFWILSSSFKTQSQIIASPPIWVFKPTFSNYVNVFHDQNFGLFLMNSSIVAVGATMFSLGIGLPAAYAISRYKMHKLGTFTLIARMMPGICYLIPWYILFSKLHLVDTYIALIASHMLVVLPLIIWIMISYFDSVPKELEQSAIVDGCTLQGAFLRIILPVSTPGIVTATTLSFLWSWNHFLFALVLSSKNTKTLPIAVYNFISYAEVNWGGVMAAAVVIIMPAIVLTMIFQRYVMQGLTMGAVKG
jgi:multiple sugar transport system permease protein